MDVVLNLNRQNISQVLSTYRVIHKPEYSKIIKTVNGEEHVVGLRYRTYIVFSLWPMSELAVDIDNALYQFPLMVEYTDPGRGVKRQEFRVESDLRKDYGLNNIYRENIYKSGEITLKALRCDE